MVFKISGTITDFSLWDDVFHQKATAFYNKHRVYPNIVLASTETYRKIDLYAQMHPDRLVSQEDNGTIETSSHPYEGLSCFVGPGYTLEFCQNEKLSVGKFTLVYDETPDFGGEPVEDEAPQAPYVYKASA
ncbi:hypothetical protein [Leadbettera azotonutricia]|uniref:Uncharacterized protein n=1 Tax=Leadbettera azotonutricia (strain ATCC BAA-888 / DSM 13862 / ZAS-9) TaxID=545695 RepID=F5Y7M7_LEAAZ|nr:hypothetical protein [Leadbettera azotonutricia]AEF81918.1 hypothetical protein TREAZ_1051 [Leadbettera azotonutricia ZAS-9]